MAFSQSFFCPATATGARRLLCFRTTNIREQHRHFLMASQLPINFKNDCEDGLEYRDARKQVVASLSRIVTKYPPASIQTGGGLYSGPISIAYMFLVLSQHYTDLEIEGHMLGTWSAAYLKQAQDNIKTYSGPRPGKCGVQDDILALLAIGSAFSKDPDMTNELVEYQYDATDDETENEWLYGRAGFLYYLRLVKASFVDDAKMIALLDDTAEDIAECILESSRPWKWHGKAYVGAVHGAFGIITQVVLLDPDKYAPRLEADLAVLLTYQFPDGNWPSSLPPGKDKLVQVCHGAPGVVICLESIKQYFPNLKERIEKAIDKARACIWQRGLLTKEPCLCHGIAGNALALEGEQFEHFLSFTTQGEMKNLEAEGMLEGSARPESLWCGEAGRAWAWAVADKQLPKRLIGFNDI